MTDLKYSESSKMPHQQEPDLYTISAKLLAIGELIKFRGGEPSLEEERVNFGIGEILTDLAEELRQKSNDLQSEN